LKIKYKTNRSLRFFLGIIVLLLTALIAVNGTKAVLKSIYPLKYKEYVYRYSSRNNLNPYLVFAIIKAESNFDPLATSNKKAKGLMQITDETGEWIARRLKMEKYSADYLYNPETNISMGCWYLGWLMKQFNDIDLVIAAYNGGHGNVNEWLKDRNLSSSGISLEKIPFKETQNYLKRVRKNLYIYKKLYEKNY